MPVLPLIDLLILMCTGSLVVGFILKAIDITTTYHPSILGFSSMDFVTIAGVCLGLALVLAARTWVKLNEHKLVVLRTHQRRSRIGIPPCRAKTGDDEMKGRLQFVSS